MKLLAESDVLHYFLTEPVYVFNEILPESAPEQPIADNLPEINIVPELTSEVLFLLPEKVENLPPETAEQFQKIVNWLDLKEKDILSATEITQIVFFQNEKTKKCISFGVDLGLIDKAIRPEKYKVKSYKHIAFILSDNLNVIIENTGLKRQLFAVLKEVFGR